MTPRDFRDDETVRLRVEAEMVCDKHGRSVCPFCQGPLRVRAWQEMHELVVEIERSTAEDYAARRMLDRALAFMAGSIVTAAIVVALRLGGAL
ncbi:MAG: hypothetical protein RL030_2778 [Pseudomonadota bacterium]|jgi:hypothetical protein